MGKNEIDFKDVKRSWSLGVFPDGNWESEDDSPPANVEVSISYTGELIIAQAMNFLKSVSATNIELNSDSFSFVFFDDDGNEYDEVELLWTGSVNIREGDIYFRVGTKHGYDYVMTESVEFNADEVINPEDSFSTIWDVDCIIEYDDGIFTTLATARKILAVLRSKNESGKGIGFDDLDECLSKVLNIPDAYHDVAEKLDVNQFHNPCDASNVDVYTLIFFEALERQKTTPENIEYLVLAAKQDLGACGEGYTIVEALDEAEFQVSR